MSVIDKLINYAISWDGYLEKKSNSQLEKKTANAGSNNYTIFAKKYKDYWNEDYQGQPWCAIFVSTVFMDVFGEDTLCPHFSYCPTGVNNFKNKKAFYTKNPQKGDVIFFTNGSRAYHVGLVTKVFNGKVYTIEGNTSSDDGVVENGGAVEQKSYNMNYSKILGYGRPDYEVVEEKIYMEQLQSIINENNRQNTIISQLGQENIHNTNDIKILKEESNRKNIVINQLGQEISTLNNQIKSLLNIVHNLNTKIDNLVNNEKIYNYISEIPSWAIPTIEKLQKKGRLNGNEKGELNLTYDMIRTLVINDRTGIYD